MADTQEEDAGWETAGAPAPVASAPAAAQEDAGWEIAAPVATPAPPPAAPGKKTPRAAAVPEAKSSLGSYLKDKLLEPVQGAQAVTDAYTKNMQSTAAEDRAGMVFKPGAPLVTLPTGGQVLEAGKEALGTLAEPVMSMATGALSSAAGGIRGLYGLATGDTADQAANKVRSTQESGTYQPRTAGGQMAMKLAAAPIEAGKAVAGYAGGVLGGAGERMGLGTTEEAGKAVGEFAGEAAPVVMGARGAVKQALKSDTFKPLTQEQQAVAAAQASGYRGRPSTINPTGFNKLVEYVAGEKNVNKGLAVHNQETTNGLARDAFNLPADAELSDATFSNIRDNAGKAYDALRDYKTPVPLDKPYTDAIAALDASFTQMRETFPALDRSGELTTLQQSLLHPENPAHPGQLTGADIVAATKRFRADAKTHLRSAKPEEVDLGFAKREAASALEGLLERHLQNTGSPLLTDFQVARKTIAASHDLEAATNTVTGNVDAVVLGRLADKRPLSGELKQIADAARTMPKITGKVAEGTGVGDLGVVGLLAAIAHKPKIVAATLLRPAAAKLASSGLMQPAVKAIKNDRPMSLAGAPAVLSSQPSDKDTTWERDAEGNLVGFTKKPSAAAQPMPGVEEEAQ